MRYLLFILTLALAVYSCDTSEPVEEDVLLSVGKLTCDISYPVSIPGFHRNYAEYNLTDPSINTIRVSFTYRTTQSNTWNTMGNSGINFQDSVWTKFEGRDSIKNSAGYQYTVTGLSYVLQNNNGIIPIFFELLLKQGLTTADYCEFLNIKVVKVN
ncbi:MAG: hypothetical protein ISS16_12265 [Ignavibacteria bacterium]|nr:hypothetical protein [Ignavibacteria bacterium]